MTAAHPPRGRQSHRQRRSRPDCKRETIQSPFHPNSTLGKYAHFIRVIFKHRKSYAVGESASFYKNDFTTRHVKDLFGLASMEDTVRFLLENRITSSWCGRSQRWSYKEVAGLYGILA